jgi:hypothetical protein
MDKNNSLKEAKPVEKTFGRRNGLIKQLANAMVN